MWPFKNKPQLELVTDGEKWAIKHCSSGRLLVFPSSQAAYHFFTREKATENCWTTKEMAQKYLKRLLA